MAVRATSSKRGLISQVKTSAKKENEMSNTKPVMTGENPITPQETAKAVTVEQIVGDGVGSQSTVSESVPVPDASVAMPQTPGGVGFTGFVDDRIIPDAGLPTEIVSGILDTRPEGHGLLRPKFAPSSGDVYISSSQIRRFAL